MKRLGKGESEQELRAEALIRGIPDLEDGDVDYALLCPDVVSPVHRGVESEVWIVRKDGRPDRVLKSLRPDMRAHFDAAVAVAAATAAGAAGVGPHVLWSDVEKGALLMERLEDGWRTATLADLQGQEAREAIVARLRRLHEGPALARRHDVFSQIRSGVEQARAARVDLPTDAWWLVDACAEIEAAVKALDVPLAPCRNDGVSSNVMIGQVGEIRLIDFDRAGMNDPLYDLAALTTEACAFETEIADWIVAWAGHFDQRLVDRCMLYGAADDLMWALWAATRAVDCKRVHVEFRKYAEWRFLRCRTTLLDRRFEERLRRL